MTDEKRRPADAAPMTENSPVSVPEEVEPDFLAEEEHDGWSEIRRRPSDPGPAR